MEKKKYNAEEFKNLPLEQRKRLYDVEKKKRPAFIPTILARSKGSTLPLVPECRVTVPENLTVLQLKMDLRKYVYKGKQHDKQSLFLFSNNLILPEAMLIRDAAAKHINNKDSDGWFYVVYNNQETFGHL